MQAFGPYSGREVVDFREAVEAGLFGIYGQTGSGKSTIFSAMTFALFGAPAKPDQEAPSLRSDHADAGVLTEVEFVFEIGARRFVIVRRPEQMRPKQRGDGETRSPHEAFLFDATGLVPDEITETLRGKIVAEKKVGVVDAAVSQMLGYGPDQFRQIVLLPQGRFETFLAAKTPDRLKILRDLFDVSLYRDFAAKLKADAEAAEQHVHHAREICAGRLATEGFESTDALAAGVADAQTRHAGLLEDEKAARVAFDAAVTALREGETIEAQFKAAEDAQEKLAELEADKSDMEALAERAAGAERARSALDAEVHVAETAGEAGEAEVKLGQAREDAADADEEANLAVEALKRETDRAEETEDLRRRVDELGRQEQTLNRAAGVKEAVETAKSKESAAAGNLGTVEKRLTSLREDERKKSDALKAARVADDHRRNLLACLGSLKSFIATAEAYESAEAGVAEAKKQEEGLIAGHAEAKQLAGAARDVFDEAERSLSQTQSLHLASKLQPGQPCSVCGSTEHPAPATGAIEHTGRDQAFREARVAWQEADGAMHAAERKLAGAQSILHDRQTRLSGLAHPEESAAALRHKVHAEERGLEALGPQADIANMEVEIEQLREEIESIAKERDALREAFVELQKMTATEIARLDEVLTAVPEPLRDQDTLATARKSASEALAERRAAKANAEAAATATREAALAARKDLGAADTAHSACRERHAKAVETMRSRLASLRLSEVEFSALKPAIATVDEDRAAVEAYRRKIETAGETARIAAEAIREQVRPDLVEVAKKKSEAEEKLSGATDARSGAWHHLDHLTKLRNELAETLVKLDEAEAASGTLRRLAALVNGDNPQKLDIETFAIGAMFDQVLAAANLRLGPMTANRYRLERELEGAGRGRRGLGIQVFDIFTGKPRPTTTLSGGETFIAALALALGLADVVESASGKVRLDTIFIDEGFGSLDTENGSGTLDQVLQVLGSLVKQNRAVGLISHVSLVQEAIPNGFYVKKRIAGSSIEARGVI